MMEEWLKKLEEWASSNLPPFQPSTFFQLFHRFHSFHSSEFASFGFPQSIKKCPPQPALFPFPSPIPLKILRFFR